jgi:hypothetical protein
MTKASRRVHDSAFKTKVVLEALKGAKTLAQLASEFGIHRSPIGRNRLSMVCLLCSIHQQPNQHCPSNSGKRSKRLSSNKLVS